MVAREQDEDARAAWRAVQASAPADDLIFLDETSTPLTMTPLRARAPRGQRAVGRVPRGRRRHVTLISTVTPTGMGASVLIEGAADRVVFDAFIEQMLVPSLRPGQTVVLDNLNVHKSPKARQLIAEAGCQLRFLPTYSPDFNPIENLFAKYKTHLRRAEARTFDDLVTATGIAFSAITASDAQGCFRDAGYRLTGQPI